MENIIEGIKKLLSLMIRKWKIYLIFFFIFGLLGYGYYNSQPNKFYSTSTFLVEEKLSSGFGGLSSLASSFGYDIGGSIGAGAGIYSGDNILEIIKSKLILKKVFLSKLINKNGDSITLADIYYVNSQFQKRWKDKANLNNLNFSKQTTNNSEKLIIDSVLNLFIENVSKNELKVSRVNKKSTLIRVEITYSNDLFAKNFIERVIDETKNLYIYIKTSTVQLNINRLEKQAESLLQTLTNRSYQVANSSIFNANSAFKDALLPNEFSQREKQIASTVYTEVIKNLESSKLSLSQITPLIEVIDNPEFPLTNKKRSFKFIEVISLFIGFSLYSFILIIQFIINNKLWNKLVE